MFDDFEKEVPKKHPNSHLKVLDGIRPAIVPFKIHGKIAEIFNSVSIDLAYMVDTLDCYLID